jgi:predicted porin
MEIYRMKKSLFAVAALSAIAGAAQAQSSVTVYGILDVGYIGTNTNTTTTSASFNGQAKTQSNQFGASAESSSRLGFKGTEDLGGGSSAFFTIEMGLNPTLGNLSGSPAANPSYDKQETTNASGSAIDNRQTFAGLKKNGIGQIAIGRQYTPIFNAGAATDAAQYTNMMGDALYSGSSAGVSVNTYLNGMTNRADSALTFQSDKFAGFSLSGMYALNQANSTVLAAGVGTNATQGGNVNWGGWGLGADYTWKKLYVTAAVQQFRTKYDSNINTAATGAGVLNLGGAGPAAGQPVTNATTVFGPTNQTDQQWYAGATYDFGILKAYLQYINRTINQNTTGGGAVDGTSTTTVIPGQQFKRTAEQIGVRSYITPVIEAWAQAGAGKYTGAINAGTNAASPSLPVANFYTYQIGSNYYLSKRTNLYAAFGAYNAISNVQNNGLAGSGSNYAVGVRHTF